MTLIMSVVGGILFALGMCMALLPEWSAMTQGVVMGAVGLAVLLAMLLVRRKMDGKPAIVFNGKAIATTLFGILATVVFGVGMCMTMIWDMMVPGIVVGIVGIVLLICLIDGYEFAQTVRELDENIPRGCACQGQQRYAGCSSPPQGAG